MNKYNIDLDRPEASCRDLSHRRTARIIAKHLARERAIYRQEKLLEIAGMALTAAMIVALFLAIIVMS